MTIRVILWGITHYSLNPNCLLQKGYGEFQLDLFIYFHFYLSLYALDLTTFLVLCLISLHTLQLQHCRLNHLLHFSFFLHLFLVSHCSSAPCARLNWQFCVSCLKAKIHYTSFPVTSWRLPRSRSTTSPHKWSITSP